MSIYKLICIHLWNVDSSFSFWMRIEMFVSIHYKIPHCWCYCIGWKTNCSSSKNFGFFFCFFSFDDYNLNCWPSVTHCLFVYLLVELSIRFKKKVKRIISFSLFLFPKFRKPGGCKVYLSGFFIFIFMISLVHIILASRLNCWIFYFF